MKKTETKPTKKINKLVIKKETHRELTKKEQDKVAAGGGCQLQSLTTN